VELVSLSPFPAECLLWEADAGQASLTVVVKVTLRLVHDGDAVVDETQLPIAADEPWDENPTASLFRPGDRAPLKPRTDLLFVGHAYSPGGTATERLVATMKIGDFAKSVTVSAPRLWTRGAAGFVPGPPLPFEQMSLRYERGALTQDNPVGVDPASPPLEGQAVGPVLAPVAPATSPCFGPVASSWRPRRRLLGEAGRFWALAFEMGAEPPNEPAPKALDFKFFNAAPPDQQVNMLRQRAEIELVNLSPTHPTLRTRLPPMKPQVFRVGPRGGRPIEIALRCDTLWIDGDRGIACLVWRGLTDVPSVSKDAVGTIYVVADPQGRRVRFEQVERAAREGIPIEATEPGAADALAVRHDAIRSRDAEGSGEAGKQGESSDAGPPREKDETRAFGPGGREEPRKVLPFAGKSAQAPTFGLPPEATGANAAFSASGASAALSASGASTPFAASGANAALSASGANAAFTASGATAAFTASGMNPSFGISGMSPSFGVSGSNPSFEASGTNPSLSISGAGEAMSQRGGDVEDDTHDREPEEAPAKALPFVERPAMMHVPPAPALPTMGLAPSRVDPAKPAMLSAPKVEVVKPAGASSPPRARSPLGDEVPMLRAEPPKVDGKSKPPPPELPAGFDPKDVPVAEYGAVSAELMIRRGERAKVLETHHLSEPAWARIHAHWTAEMGRETARGESRLLAQFDAAYVETMGRLRKPIGVPEYALILVAIERGAIDKQLAALSLTLSDLMRVQRVWTRRLAEDPELGKVLGKAVEEARAAVT